MTAGRKTATEYESWDAFWAEQMGSRTETIRGVTVQVPTDLPIAMEHRIDDLRASEDPAAVAELLAMLFGQDVYDQWEQAGMGLLELQTVLTWGIGHASGTELTFGQALEMVRTGDTGKLPAPAAGAGANRAARRAGQKPRSASTGGPSKRISSASTGSGRRTSRG